MSAILAGLIGDLGENNFTLNLRLDPSLEVGFSYWDDLVQSGPPRGMLYFIVSFEVGPLCRPLP